MSLTKKRQEPGDAAVDGLFSGFIAGFPMAAWVLVVGWLSGDSPSVVLGGFSLTGASDALIGVTTHFSVSAIYGAIFGLISGFLPKRVVMMPAGLIYGLLLYVIADLILFPGVNDQLMNYPPILLAGGHVLYGLVLSFLVARRTQS